MKLFMGEAGKSCVEVCKMSGELNNVTRIVTLSIRLCYLSRFREKGRWAGDGWNMGVGEKEKGRR